MSTLKVDGIRSNSASSDAITLAGDGTCTANITNNLTNRNVIINGGCLVAQRGTSSTSSDYGSVDRMKLAEANMAQLAWLQKQTSDGPDGFSKCWEFDVTTPETSLGADEIVYMRYMVEAQDLTSFYNANGTGKNFTLSFYVKAAQTGTYNIGIHKADNTVRFITTTYTISQANTWQRVVWNVTGDTGTSGINADNGQGFQISFMLAAGSNYTSGGVQSSWGSFSNSLMAGGHAVNVASSTDNYWRITGIQLELGDHATSFEHRSYADELRRCQRYYQRGRYSTFCQVGTPGTYYFSRANIPLFTPMRAAITGTMNAASNISNRYFAYKTWADQTNVTAAPASTSFASRASDGGDNPHTDIVSVDLNVTIASGSSNAALPANGPGGNSVYPITFHDVELDAEL